MKFPESGSIWPVHLVANPRWVVFNLKRWDLSRWRLPPDAAYEFRACALFCDYLYRLVRQARPERVVETGVFFGRSSAAILSALERNGRGRLVSIDLPVPGAYFNSDGRYESSPANAGRTGCLVPRQLRARWELRLGDARELLPAAVSGGVDLFLHDSEHSEAHMTFEYETAWARLPTGGVLASDDTDWSAAWPRFLARHAGEFCMLPYGPGYVRALRRGPA
jgi:hypothetical protein